MRYQTPKGTFDRLPKDSAIWRTMIQVARQTLERAGAQEIHTPIFEDVGVFHKAVGESSDIVRKEMYTFTDKGNRQLTLRPEATAPIVRAYLEHGMASLPSPVRLWTFAPMFRAEMPQKGRQRQFHQFGLEILGANDAVLDAESIALGHAFLQNLGLRHYQIHLGSVGDPEDKARYNQYLQDLFSPVMARLSQDSQVRLALNPMRILDSKDTGDKALLAALNVRPMLEFLSDESAAHFAEVRTHLENWGVPFVVDASIVRGLDYYRRTAFEFIDTGEALGAQGTLLAGGRYDGLAEMLGGPHTPGVGWGCGAERLILALEAEGVVIAPNENLLAYVIPLDEAGVSEAFRLAQNLRALGRVQATHKIKSVGKALGDAEKFGARFAILIGEQERKTDVATVKTIATREQHQVAFADLKHWLQNAQETLQENA